MHIKIYFISWFSVYVKETTRMVRTVCALLAHQSVCGLRYVLIRNENILRCN